MQTSILNYGKGVEQMKKLTRILSIFMIVSILFSIFAITASAYEYTSGSTSKYSRTFYVYHTWGKAVKITRTQAGDGRDPLNTKISSYGKFTYTVKDSKGKVVRSGNWFADRTKSETLVKATQASGKYTITISGVKIDRAAQSTWKTYPKYKITY